MDDDGDCCCGGIGYSDGNWKSKSETAASGGRDMRRDTHTIDDDDDEEICCLKGLRNEIYFV